VHHSHTRTWTECHPIATLKHPIQTKEQSIQLKWQPIQTWRHPILSIVASYANRTTTHTNRTTQPMPPTMVQWAKGVPHRNKFDCNLYSTQWVWNNGIGNTTMLSTRPSRLHQLIATIGKWWPFPLWFFQPCRVDLEKFFYLVYGHHANKCTAS
jgi:hypothetical protein